MLDPTQSSFSKEELFLFFESEARRLAHQRVLAQDRIAKRPILAQEAYVKGLIALFSTENTEKDPNIGRAIRNAK